jgi:hypothetical protein
MSDWVLFEHIPGVRAVYVKDNGDEWLIRTDYFGADRLKEANKASVEQTEGRRFGDYRPLASIPHNEMRDTGLEEALRQGDDRFVNRWLNDGDNRGYRTSRGRA